MKTRFTLTFDLDLDENAASFPETFHPELKTVETLLQTEISSFKEDPSSWIEAAIELSQKFPKIKAEAFTPFGLLTLQPDD